MRGLSDNKQAELAASLAEPFQQPGSHLQQHLQQQHGQQQQQSQPRPDAASGVSEPGSTDPSVHDSERSFELNPGRFDSESGSALDLDPHVGGPVKHGSPSEVSREELEHQLDSTLQGSMRATL